MRKFVKNCLTPRHNFARVRLLTHEVTHTMDHFRKTLEDDAREAFDCFVVDLTEGELIDMLLGNPARASGLPDLHNWSEYSKSLEV